MRDRLASSVLCLVVAVVSSGIGCREEVAPQRLRQAASAADLGQPVGDIGGQGEAGVLGDATGGGDGAGSCGAVTSQGCCDGETLWWCEEGVLTSESCAAKPKCGWNSSGFYDCNTSGSPDPLGTAPFDCNDLFGDGGLPSTDLGGDAVEGPCGSIALAGCCDGERLKFCEDGVLETIDCSFNPSCGWSPAGGFYNCGSTGGEDPTGSFPKVCPGAQPVDGPSVPDGTDGPGSDAAALDGGDGGADENGCSCGVRAAGRIELRLLGCLGLLGAVIAIVIRRRRRRPCA